MRVQKNCEESGDAKDTVMSRIHSGIWAANKKYKRTGPKTPWINRVEVDKWIDQQPHVEAARQPVSKSARRQKATADTARTQDTNSSQRQG